MTPDPLYPKETSVSIVNLKDCPYKSHTAQYNVKIDKYPNPNYL